MRSMLILRKIKSKRKTGNRRAPLPFRGKRAGNCSHIVGKSLGKGLDKEKETLCDLQTSFYKKYVSS